MIDPINLSEKDIGKRVIWQVRPGTEELAQLGAWSKDLLVIFISVSGSKYMRPVEVSPTQVRWADEKIKRAG